MHEHLHPGKAVSGVPPILHQFLQSAMIAQNQVQGRDLRELQTIALAGDAILKGHLEGGLDILLQRRKRLEAQASGLMPARMAEHLELLPPTRPTSLSLAEREECANLSKRWESHSSRSSGHQGGGRN